MNASEVLLLDRDVLAEGALCEFQSWRAARDRGGAAVLPWRASYAEAKSAGVEAVPEARALPDSGFSQCAVHLQKSRPATWSDLTAAWRMLEPGGRLLLCGGNELGIQSAVKRLAGELGQTQKILSNRAHARVALFVRDTGSGPTAPAPLEITAHGCSFETDPGVFSAKRLDAGTELVLESLEAWSGPPPRRLADIGCGAGTLGLSALRLWPRSRAVLADADARAERCAARNAERLGIADRCETLWWDAFEPAPARQCDLVLLNPPFHQGKAVDLEPARRMFRALATLLGPRGRALIVANRRLPYEQDLRALGTMQVLREARGYKLLEFTRGSR
jgi:16S rRNA (guanine1207-N2)-methyltransferase